MGKAEVARTSQQEVINLKSPQKTVELKMVAAIPEVVSSPLGASPRLAKHADEHILQKTARRTAERNLEDMKGNSNCPSLFSLDKNVVASNLTQIGVSLVPSSIDNFCKNAFSTINLGNLESLEWDFPVSDEDESLEEIECLAVKELCGELWEEIYDEDNVYIRRKKGDGRKKNKSSAKPLKNKTCKVNMNKTMTIISK